MLRSRAAHRSVDFLVRTELAGPNASPLRKAFASRLHGSPIRVIEQFLQACRQFGLKAR